jgi:phytoene dehydrogenase-like protein
MPSAVVSLEGVADSTIDVIVVGAGHNGLVAALCAAKAGQRVLVVERAGVIGGATRTERPFEKAPRLPQSTGAYLLGLMPPELEALLGVTIPTLRRDPHYFLPTESGRYLLFGSDEKQLERQLLEFFSRADLLAHRSLQAELAELREDIAPTWMREPLSIENTAERYVRPQLREKFVALCRGSIGDYLSRFGFESELLMAMYAVTDGFSGLFGSWDTPGTGMNFLVHNMCRRPGSDGTWMIVEGGMGTVVNRLSEALARAGGRIVTGEPVEAVLVEHGVATGVRLASGAELRAKSVIVNADPFTMLDLVPSDALPAEYVAHVQSLAKPGSTLKLNLALSGMPRFTCLPNPPVPFGPTIHLLPEHNVIAELRAGFEAAKQGKLYDFPTIEWYVHSAIDRSMTDESGRLSAALFVQWVPYDIAGSTWEAEGERYEKKLLALCDRFAPGTSELVVDSLLLHPRAIEERFGIRHGHIHHVDNSFGFADRLPHATPIAHLYSASAGTHPAGSVIGCAGYLAAKRCLLELGAGI